MPPGHVMCPSKIVQSDFMETCLSLLWLGIFVPLLHMASNKGKRIRLKAYLFGMQAFLISYSIKAKRTQLILYSPSNKAEKLMDNDMREISETYFVTFRHNLFCLTKMQGSQGFYIQLRGSRPKTNSAILYDASDARHNEQVKKNENLNPQFHHQSKIIH